MGERSGALLQLRPVTFRYKQDPSGERQYGLVAEEVAAVYPELVTRTPSGEVQSVRYEELIPMLLNEVQRQEHALGAQTQQIARLGARNEEQRSENAALAARLTRLEEASQRVGSVARR